MTRQTAMPPRRKTLKVFAPENEFSGAVVGVDFIDGSTDVDAADTAALAYFRRHGYGINEPPAPRPARAALPEPQAGVSGHWTPYSSVGDRARTEAREARTW